MFRALGIFGLGFLFVMISPALRVSLLADAAAIHQTIEDTSPFSYVGLGLLTLMGVMFAMHRASKPRC
jgi:hypothetical protein